MIDRRCRRPLFSRLVLVLGLRSDGVIEPLLFHSIELLTQLRGEIHQGRDEGAGLGLVTDLHGRLRGGG